MKKTSIYFTTILLIMICQQSVSQITQLEIATGNNKTDFTLLSIKPLDENGKFSISTLGFFQKYHHSENFNFDEVGVQTSLFWNLTKSISIGPTIYYNSVAGFTERITLLINKRTGRFNYTIIHAVVHSNITNNIGAEVFVEMQYIQPIKNKLNFLIYTKLLTNWQEFKVHSRSYQYLRVGLSKNNNQFGLALSFDEYGNIPIEKKSFGIFIRKNFIEK